MSKEIEPPIMAKAYEASVYMMNLVEKMHRAHKFTLGDRIAALVCELLESLTVARYTSDKAVRLKNLNLLLERLRVLLRLAKDLKAMSVKAYGQATGMVEEVGRMLGGWIRHIEAREQ
jgi:hypothetical protein